MILRKHHVSVSDVRFSEKSEMHNGVLFINKTSFEQALVSKAFSSLQLEIAKPGESIRLTNVGDIVQPVVKKGHPEKTFPGYIGQLEYAGMGDTVCLDGIAVAEISEVPLMQSTILDMCGSGAEHTPYSKKILIAVAAKPSDGVDRDEYLAELNRVSCKLAVMLAELALDVEPAYIQEYMLAPPAQTADDTLPRVAYIYQIFAHKNMTEALFYGGKCLSTLPTIVHPNEVLDGALVNRNYDLVPFSDPTYTIQNHPVIQELYDRDGKSIRFCGVVMVNGPSTIEEKTLDSKRAAFLAKYVLHADYAILTKEGGGHTQIDLELVCDFCAELDIKTAIIIAENVSTSGKTEEAILFSTSNANAMISAGCLEIIDLPAVDRLIGTTPITDMQSMQDLRAPCSIWNKYIRGALSQLGESMYTSYKY